MAGAPAVETEDLSLRYGGTAALDRVSLRLEESGVYGLLGRNGAGKSSLLALLAGYLRPSGGTVRVGGEPVFDNRAATSRICLIRGSGETGGVTRVGDALGLAEAARPHWDGDYAAVLLDRFALAPRRRIDALSQGQLGALGVALGLASRAPLTAFDETHLRMDAPSRHLFYRELLDDILRYPRTVILSTHLIEEAARVFEGLLILDQGRLVLHEDADRIRERAFTVTGPEDRVARFADGGTLLHEKRLGGTAAATHFGEPDPTRADRARGDGLELSPVPLQDLFIHLTDPARGAR
ncbi:ABC-2 type transport system ATP-binding protein [Nocardiopsis mwathae]|uniref:ABC-2 type transport system ATP-binding protein n=1 Tax=Nocardiopsis mwathae TaxID=1472723 RepID=A0A7X0D7Q4_9ACTN|nr:ABC transporter ATP-binding protein [Nocardiopsis mwathae]MBB6174590.1 ABC-2 type transport system ATP-binding protein [Nocardiopsis mwathae]